MYYRLTPSITMRFQLNSKQGFIDSGLHSKNFCINYLYRNYCRLQTFFSLLDPNLSLIDIDGKLINNINLTAILVTHRNGTIADGISKPVLIVESTTSLQFSINDTTNGTLSSLKQALEDGNNSSLLSSMVLVILVKENQLSPLYILLQTVLIMIKYVIELSM
jgi:hypothetical protein